MLRAVVWKWIGEEAFLGTGSRLNILIIPSQQLLSPSGMCYILLERANHPREVREHLRKTGLACKVPWCAINDDGDNAISSKHLQIFLYFVHHPKIQQLLSEAALSLGLAP